MIDCALYACNRLQADVVECQPVKTIKGQPGQVLRHLETFHNLSIGLSKLFTN